MPRPNILWIVTTQWRAQAAGFAGDPNACTPALDRLAKQGINFAQAVTPHPFGPFARAALLTGVPSPENGMRDYFDPLPTSARTVAHDLAALGYATAFFGKWHLSPRDPSAPLVGEVHARTIVPVERRGGFEFWEGFEGGFQLNDPWLHGTRLPQALKFPGYQSDVVSARAGEWMAEKHLAATFATATAAEEKRGTKGESGRPWFCVVSLEAPHPPYDAPLPEGMAARRPSEIVLSGNVPRGGEAEAKARRELVGYYGHIEATDRAIGRLLQRVGDDTLVVFTSAHGDMHGAHGLFRKGWPHEESVRVPLLLRPSRTSDRAAAIPDFKFQISWQPVSLIDLRRWMVEAAARGEEIATPQSLRFQATRLAARISMPSVVALPHQCDRVWRGARTSKRKLVVNDDGSPWLFFDLEQDPLELRNLVEKKERAREIAELRAEIEQ